MAQTEGVGGGKRYVGNGLGAKGGGRFNTNLGFKVTAKKSSAAASRKAQAKKGKKR